jgi:hypothetical protein
MSSLEEVHIDIKRLQLSTDKLIDLVQSLHTNSVKFIIKKPMYLKLADKFNKKPPAHMRSRL